MKFIELELKGAFIIEPTVHQDDRGYFMESFRSDLFEKQIGNVNFVQDNESLSSQGVLRGLHFQLPPKAQSKLVRVVSGKILDVIVDLREDSPSFKCHSVIELSAENKRQVFIPKGFAHGYLTISQSAIFQYKVDNHYSASHDSGIRYDDPELGIRWPTDALELQLSAKDVRLGSFQDFIKNGPSRWD